MMIICKHYAVNHNDICNSLTFPYDEHVGDVCVCLCGVRLYNHVYTIMYIVMYNKDVLRVAIL